MIHLSEKHVSALVKGSSWTSLNENDANFNQGTKQHWFQVKKRGNFQGRIRLQLKKVSYGIHCY